MAFLDFRFKDFKLAEQQVTVVTGTAGIGKTMFALHAALVATSGVVILSYFIMPTVFGHSRKQILSK